MPDEAANLLAVRRPHERRVAPVNQIDPVGVENPASRSATRYDRPMLYLLYRRRRLRCLVSAALSSRASARSRRRRASSVGSSAAPQSSRRRAGDGRPRARAGRRVNVSQASRGREAVEPSALLAPVGSGSLPWQKLHLLGRDQPSATLLQQAQGYVRGVLGPTSLAVDRPRQHQIRRSAEYHRGGVVNDDG